MKTIETELVVVGAGPGGHAAALAAARRGVETMLVDCGARLGGVCLNRGCIPSKAFLHATALIEEAKQSGGRGISFDAPRINLDRLREWKESVVDALADGARKVAGQQGVTVMRGRGYFESSERLRIETGEGQRYLAFEKAIIAVGSEALVPKAFDLGNPRVMTSREALHLGEVPERLLVIGGGYIGMELGTVYARLGSEVVVAEALESILTGADADLVRPVRKAAEAAFREIRTGAEVVRMATSGKQIEVTIKPKEGEQSTGKYDRVLVAAGRRPHTDHLGLENTKVRTDEKGFIEVDEQQRSADPAICAIGDVVGEPMLAHKATREGLIAVETVAGERLLPNGALLVPAVVYTDPELAWVGLTEEQAKEEGREVRIAKTPWSASGRAHTLDRTDGLTKFVVDPETERLMGVGIVGHNAGDLISEGVLAIEMGATAYDIAASIHPHPTLSETLMETAGKV